MASHPHHAIGANGNGNGANGNGAGATQKKLEKLLAYHGGIADALRTTLALLRGDAVEHREHRAPDVLAAAVQLDAARREHTRGPNTGEHTAARHERRKKTAALLASYDLHKPTPPRGKGKTGVLIQHGFLKKVRGGYVRTTKEFQP
jgi:hypothetical protein